MKTPARAWVIGIAGALLAVVSAIPLSAAALAEAWPPDELSVLRSLWIGSLPQLPSDPSNAVGDDPRAAEFGHRLFFDTRFSANGAVSCASCHKPELGFTDGLPLAKGIGAAARHTMTVIGSAYSPWLFWDGRKDSLWSQALGPIESTVEHGGTRVGLARTIASDSRYRKAYEALFGPLPDVSDPKRFPAGAAPIPDPAALRAWRAMTPRDREAVSRVFANAGKAIAAYERLIQPGASRFDGFVQALLDHDRARADRMLTPDEQAGLRLFIGKGQCVRCHNGPLLTNNDFHNTGLRQRKGGAPDAGRLSGIVQAISDPFNCLGRFSGAGGEACAELRFAKTSGPELAGSFRTPTLRNAAGTAPYMHDGRFADIDAVLKHYNRAPEGSVGKTELTPLRLHDRELAQLAAFLRSLNGPLSTPERFLKPPG